MGSEKRPELDPISDQASLGNLTRSSRISTESSEACALKDEIYAQLRAIAQSRLSDESTRHTLQATALVHEAWLKLCKRGSVMALDRGRFVMAAAEAMRRILIDHARTRVRLKRGGHGAAAAARSTPDVTDVLDLAGESDPEQIEALEQAVARLQIEHPNACDVVKLRFFAGLSIEETAKSLGISDSTVKREWRFARAWLYSSLA
jgi:RNA polymerase sigma factor (TIGR02999 family)